MDPAQLTHLSLCTGYGGIDLGLRRVLPGLRTIAYSEIEEYACGLLAARMESGHLDPAPIWPNVKTFPFREFHGCVDILSGGYPCQPFSAAGKRLGKEDPRHLWPWIADGIRLCQPALCFFENVEGHITLGLRDVLRELASLSYRATWGIFSAAEVGAPHQRKRVFILAHRIGPRLEGYAGNVHGAGGQPDGQSGSIAAGSLSRWPSRPGEPQHGWEPPRVVSNVRGQASNLANAKNDGHAGWQGVRDDRQGTVSTEQSDCSGQACGPSQLGGCGPVGDTDCRRLEGASAEQGRATDAVRGRGEDGKAIVGDARGEESSGLPSWRGRDEAAETWQSGDAMADASEQHGQWRSARTGWGSGSEINATGGDAAKQRQAQPSLGGDANGSAGGLGYADLSIAYDNRTDELRLLGNGVVPATAELAFRTLLNRLTNE